MLSPVCPRPPLSPSPKTRGVPPLFARERPFPLLTLPSLPPSLPPYLPPSLPPSGRGLLPRTLLATEPEPAGKENHSGEHPLHPATWGAEGGREGGREGGGAHRRVPDAHPRHEGALGQSGGREEGKRIMSREKKEATPLRFSCNPFSPSLPPSLPPSFPLSSRPSPSSPRTRSTTWVLRPGVGCTSISFGST